MVYEKAVISIDFKNTMCYNCPVFWKTKHLTPTSARNTLTTSNKTKTKTNRDLKHKDVECYIT